MENFGIFVIVKLLYYQIKFMRNLFTFIALFISIHLLAQDNFNFTPEKPKAGDEISFSYTQGGDLSGIMKMPEAYALLFTKDKQRLVEIPLKRESGKLVGKVKTDTAVNLVAFGFKIDDKFDNNGNNGFFVPLYNGDAYKEGSYLSQAKIYEYLGEWKLGIPKDNNKIISSYEKEFATYPSQREDNLIPYLFNIYRNDKEKGTTAIQAEIEKSMQKGLNTVEDYNKVINLYNIIRLRHQASWLTNLRNDKFPDRPLSANDYFEKFNAEQDNLKKEAIIEEAKKVAATSKDKQMFESYIGYFQSLLLSSYSSKKDWTNFKRYSSLISDKSKLAPLYNNIAWKMYEDSTELPMALELATTASEYAKAEMKKPSGTRPDLLTNKEWEKERKSNYAMYADTYAMLLYKIGNYKKAYPIINEVAMGINEGKAETENNNYALIAEKVLTQKQLQPQLEQFVRIGKSSENIKSILKKYYTVTNKSDVGFEDYISKLEKEAELKMLEDLKKEVLNTEAPAFTLLDGNGNKVSLADLKGKVVILDFWATWCGPCRASFPGMQKMVNKYQDDANVKFFFVNSWEQADDKVKTATDFMKNNKYNFTVLMDIEDKVIGKFGVDGIPTKFVIGADGKVKFKSVGFEGTDELLMKKLSAMIEYSK